MPDTFDGLRMRAAGRVAGSMGDTDDGPRGRGEWTPRYWWHGAEPFEGPDDERRALHVDEALRRRARERRGEQGEGRKSMFCKDLSRPAGSLPQMKGGNSL